MVGGYRTLQETLKYLLWPEEASDVGLVPEQFRGYLDPIKPSFWGFMIMIP